MRRLIRLLIFFNLIALGVWGQDKSDNGLVLKGRIYAGKKEEHKDYVVWKARLSMELTNTGTKPIILINPTLQFGTGLSGIFIVTADAYGNPVIVLKKSVSVSDEANKSLDTLAKDLNQNEPPQLLTHILESGASFWFDDSITIKQGFTEDKIKNKTWEGVFPKRPYSSEIQTWPVASLTWLFVRYQYSLENRQSEPQLLEHLRSKWKAFGILPVDKNGDYTITSDPINIYNLKWETE